MRLTIGPTGLLHAYVWRKCASRVYAGPFKGMRYVQTSVGSSLIPKLLGTYEMEIHAAVEKAAERKWDKIVNIGAAEGYYTVGFAMRCPQARIMAFDSNPKAHGLIRDLALMNSQQVEVHGTCDSAALKQALQGAGPTLLVCDIEGAEAELLDPSMINILCSTYLLVEVHEGLVPGLGAVLADRFASTHRLQWFHQANRKRKDFPLKGYFASLYPQGHIISLLDESRRRRTDWFMAEPLG